MNFGQVAFFCIGAYASALTVLSGAPIVMGIAVAMIITGLAGGCLVQLFDLPPDGAFQPECNNACCTEKDQKPKILGALKHGFVTLPGDIGKAMFVGLVVAGVISAVIPDDFFAQFLGGGIAAMFAMMILGIPIYVCATASVPVVAALPRLRSPAVKG